LLFGSHLDRTGSGSSLLNASILLALRLLLLASSFGSRRCLRSKKWKV